MPNCVADVDDAEGLQVACELDALIHDGRATPKVSLQQCEMAPGGAVQVPADAVACWVPLVGAAMHDECRDQGWNLELEVHWRDDPPSNVELVPTCTLSDDRARDCPALPG
jgi:hypothetical protein